MIPESLRLRNFLSHRETDLDFRGVHLASLVGENGAGKSALLDAITWAVWGRSRVPYGHDDDLVHHGESDLEVEFVFRIPYQSGDEQRCRIMRRRELRGRRSVSSLLDFEVETSDGWRVLTSDTIRDTQQHIIDYLGLDYDTFINSAYLRQGHADEFTVQTSSDRKRVLGTVLGLDRWTVYQDRARVALSEVQGQLRETDRRLEEIERELGRRPDYELALETAEVQAQAAEADLEAVQGQMDELTRVREQVVALQRQLVDLGHRQEESEAEIAKLQAEIGARQERLAYYRTLMEQAEEIEARHTAYEAALADERMLGQKLSQAAKLQADKSRWEAELAAARQALTEEIRSLEQEEARLERLMSDARQALERTGSELRSQLALLAERFAPDRLLAERAAAAEALSALEEAAREQERVRTALQESEVEQSRLLERNRQLRDLMSETKTRLDALAEAQATCPLCGQSLSAQHRQQVLDEVEAQGRAMGDEFRANRGHLAEIEAAQRHLRAELQDLDQRLRARPAQEQALARLQQQVEQSEQARARARDLEAQAAAIDARVAAQDYAVAEREAARRVADDRAARQARLEAHDFATEARASLAQVLKEMAALGYDAAAHEQIKARVEALAGAESDYRELEKARVGVEGESEVLARLDGQVTAIRGRLDQLSEERARLEARVLEMEPRLAEAPILAQRLNEARVRATTARQRVGAARQNLAALETLERRLDDTRTQHDSLAQRVAVFTELRDAFGVNGIPAMIIEHTLPELERDANRILQQLTGGRMHVRFETQRETKSGTLRETLDIIISDEKGTRPYEGFSGGEQFRINFAIRVALSRMLTQRSGVRLRSLFVDEGFGALDAEGRQRLVEAVKAVQDEFEMILLITHIDELREAFPTQIQVTKTDSGSQVDII